MIKNRLTCAGLLLLLAGIVTACDGGAPTAPSSPPPAPLPPPIGTLVQVTGATIRTGPAAVEQSVTVNDGPFNNIRFAWDVPPGGSTATGSLFILTNEYLGRVSELGTSAPGFLARSTRIENGEYVFDSSVTLLRGTSYWFASDSDILIYSSRGDSDVYAGGQLYVAGQIAFDNPFNRLWLRPNDSIDTNFTLRGSAIAP